jgi:hypothetical protein
MQRDLNVFPPVPHIVQTPKLKVISDLYMLPVPFINNQPAIESGSSGNNKRNS